MLLQTIRIVLKWTNSNWFLSNACLFIQPSAAEKSGAISANNLNTSAYAGNIIILISNQSCPFGFIFYSAIPNSISFSVFAFLNNKYLAITKRKISSFGMPDKNGRSNCLEHRRRDGNEKDGHQICILVHTISVIFIIWKWIKYVYLTNVYLKICLSDFKKRCLPYISMCCL